MKKILRIVGIVAIVLFAALLILPYAFQGKIVEVVKKEANHLLNAKVDFDKLSLSFIRNFPKATVSIDHLTITGAGEFEKDTLAAVPKIRVTVNLKSIFGSGGFEISQVLLDEPIVNAIVLKDGKANWDIMQPSDESATTTSAAEKPSSFKMQLQDVSINKATIIYRDDEGGMKAVLENVNLALSGDMTADHTTLQTLIDIASLSFYINNIPYLSKANLELKMDMDADLQAMKFRFNKNTLRLNAIEAGFDGWLTMLENGYDMDIKLNTSKIDFKQLLSLIPAIYAKEFAAISATGNVLLDAAIKGKMENDHIPSFDIKLAIDNGRFKYPDLPKAVEKIAVNVMVNNPGGIVDLTTIDVQKFHFELAGNPFNLAVKILTPVSDADISGTANGKIDLGMIKDIYPLDAGSSLNGVLTADLIFAARLSQIEKEQYDKITANGDLALKNMTFKSGEMSDIFIQTADLKFSPRYVDLQSFDMKIGRNDVKATGKLYNVIAFALNDQTLNGVLNIQSTYFNLNDFLSGDTDKTDTATDTAVLTAFEIPKNIDFTADASFKEIIFDKLEMKNTSGKLILKEGVLDLKNLSTNALSGTMVLNGYYSTATDAKHPEVNLGVNIQNASFAQTFESFEMIKKLAPIFETIGGKYSIKLNMHTQLDENLSPDLSSLVAAGALQSKEINIQNVKALSVMASALNNEKLASLQAKDVNLNFQITDGRVHTKPFDLNTGAGKLNVSGSTGLDQTIDYNVKVNLPENTLEGKIGKLIAGVKIKGTFTHPKIELDTKEMVSQLIDEAKTGITQKIDDAKEETNKKLLEEAQKQGEKIKAEAKAAGDKLVEEAEKQGKKLIDEANHTSNALLKVAAVKTAEQTAAKLKEEAEKQARKLNDEAEKQVQKLIDNAVIK